MSSAAWTWMVYLATHNNVAQEGESSVARMRQARLSPEVRVLVQQSTPQKTVRRNIGAEPELAADLGQVDSGEPGTVLDFVRWAKVKAPAQRYGLILWSHGSGWEPAEMERQARRTPAEVPVTASELTRRGPGDEGRQIFFSTTMRKLLALPTPPRRAVAFDNGSGHSLDTIELGEVASGAAQILEQPLALLGMNACQMSTIEVAYQLRNHVGLYVASPEDMPVQSWPYDDILTRLAAQPELDLAALGQLIVERYAAFYQGTNLPWGQGRFPAGATLTALQTATIGRLADAVRALVMALTADLAGQLQAIWDAHLATHAFKFRLYDLGSFCRTLEVHPCASPATVQAAHAVVSALEDPAFRVAYAYTAPAYADTDGLTTYLMFPEPGEKLSPYYDETAYAAETGWGAFLKAYHAAVPY